MSTSGRTQPGSSKPKPMLGAKSGFSQRPRSTKKPATAPSKPSKEDASVLRFKQELEKRFGPLVESLGSGDSGQVYKVRQQGGSVYALKVPNSQKRFALKDEYDKAKMLTDHHNLIQHLELIQEGAPPFWAAVPLSFGGMMDVDPVLPQQSPSHGSKTSYALLLEYAAGGSLQDRLDQGPLDEETLRPLIRDVLEGLHHIHETQFMHLDVKPANIFLHGPKGPAMVGDFGKMTLHSDFAKDMEGKEGDARYMAPEVINNDQPSSIPIHSPDIFSLGITILECATDLDIPCNDEPWQQLRENACPQMFLNPLSPELQQMILKMLQKDPRLRPTAEELLHEPWFESLPLISSANKPRKSRSTSSPSTPFNLGATHHTIATSAPTHHYLNASRYAGHHQSIRGGIGPFSASSSAAQGPTSRFEPVARRINFSTEN